MAKFKMGDKVTLIAERKWELEMKRFDETFEPIDGDKFKFCLSQLDIEGEWPEKA